MPNTIPSFLHYSLVSVGVMDENNLESPILSWQDPRPHNTPLDSLGLTALGSGVFFKYRDGQKVDLVTWLRDISRHGLKQPWAHLY